MAIVFLILTPEMEESAQVQILATIARGMEQDDMRGKLMGATQRDTALGLLDEISGSAALP